MYEAESLEEKNQVLMWKNDLEQIQENLFQKQKSLELESAKLQIKSELNIDENK